jgi:hypothetical protein
MRVIAQLPDDAHKSIRLVCDKRRGNGKNQQHGQHIPPQHAKSRRATLKRKANPENKHSKNEAADI